MPTSDFLSDAELNRGFQLVRWLGRFEGALAGACVAGILVWLILQPPKTHVVETPESCWRYCNLQHVHW